jgi:hypothetical protein
MIEQQNIEDGLVQQRLSSTTPTPRGNNSNNNNFAFAQQQLQQLQLENRGGAINNKNVNNNFVQNNQRAATSATTPKQQPETSTPNHYRDRMQKIQYNVIVLFFCNDKLARFTITYFSINVSKHSELFQYRIHRIRFWMQRAKRFNVTFRRRRLERMSLTSQRLKILPQRRT